MYSLSKKELKGKTKFAIISVKTVKLAMENVQSLFYRVLIRNIHLFKSLKRNIVLIVITPLICVVTVDFKVLYKSILHSSVHRVTVSILYIVLPFGSIITILVH